MKIRNMQIDDYDKVYALWCSCSGLGLNSIDDSREGIAKFLARNPATCFVAEEQGQIIGAILAGHDGRRGHIGHTAVSAAHRRHGIGKLLVETTLNALKQQGISKVNLVVFSDNENGNLFWDKMGFVKRSDLIYRDHALTDKRAVKTQ